MFLKIKFIIPLAVIAGAISTFAIYRYMEKQKNEIQAPAHISEKVIIAKAAFQIGHTIDESDIVISEWPQEIIPDGSFSDDSNLIGRVIKNNIYKGEPILESKLAPPGSSGGFSSIIPQGMRALTVSVDTYSGVGGFILPDTRVDVMVTVPSHKDNEKSSTKIILEHILVLAVDQTFMREGDDPVIVQSVTLLVDPKQAEKLVLAATEGKLQLSLRNNTDHASRKTPGVQLRELISKPAPRRNAGRSRRQNAKANINGDQRVVEVIRSNERSHVSFKDQQPPKNTGLKN